MLTKQQEIEQLKKELEAERAINKKKNETIEKLVLKNQRLCNKSFIPILEELLNTIKEE